MRLGAAVVVATQQPARSAPEGNKYDHEGNYSARVAEANSKI